jgi:hypothetical protein
LTGIDPSQSLIGLLKARIASARPRASARSARSQETPAASASSLAQRIACIGADDPDRKRKAVRLFLESELVREFGPAVLNDPGFPQMLDAVQDQMAQDPASAQAVAALGDLLLR